MTEPTQARPHPLNQNLTLLTEIKALKDQREIVLKQVEQASMFQKAGLISDVAMISLGIESKLTEAVTNLTRLAAIQEQARAGAQTQPQTDPETADDGQETEQH